jgi:hypothetical protein
MNDLKLSGLLMIVFLSAGGIAQAETQPQAAVASQPSLQRKPDNVTLAILIKSAIIAVQQANFTGNYSVLRDLGTPEFHDHFDQARLTSIFASFRARAINLGPSVMLSPILTRPAELTANGQLRVVGIFPTQPLQIQFALLFKQVEGVWLIDGVAVDAIAPNEQVSQARTSAKSTASASASKQTRTAKKTEAAFR